MSQTFASWNRITEWLRRMDSVRRAAWRLVVIRGEREAARHWDVKRLRKLMRADFVEARRKRALVEQVEGVPARRCCVP
jgi:hypothetical protein